MEELAKAEKKLIESLRSDKPQVVLESILQIRKSGNCRILPSILDLLLETDDSNVEAKIIELLFDLKSQDCAPTLIEAIQDERMEYYHNFFVAAFWQSSLDGSEYLQEFVRAGIKGDYMVCLECLTVIENFDSSFSSEEIMECNADLVEAILDETNKDKLALLEQLKDVVNNLPLEAE